ncbi:MAG: RsmB/NOP family class I SAM-dependent RNA methyltransferase [Magnetococcales bacterium]|nr:RsmB/NOP family class I SAM-dependent RNA methyltransferase [Magnetococcales bacterium]
MDETRMPSPLRVYAPEAGLLLQQILPAAFPPVAGPGDPDLVATEGTAADQVLETFFRDRHAGSRERAGIAALVFYVLRHRRYVEALLRAVWPADTVPDGMSLALAASVAMQEEATPGEEPFLRALGPLRLLLGLSGDDNRGPPPPLHPAERLSLPDWLWQRLVEQWGAVQAEQLGAALNQPASVDLRVNGLRATREQLLAALAEAQMAAIPTPCSPVGVRLRQRQSLGTLACFKQGWFEVQDEGSQLIAPLLTPQPGETVVDLCAGGGGKTLHLAALMRNRGRIVATDTDERRLARLGVRGKRAGVRIIQTVALRHERDPRLKSLAGRADAVLVDAPCSGLGTLRRRPEIKWRLQAAQVEAYHYRQCALLEAGARLTRPGGRLLYATCSLLQRENQAVVEAFLADNRQFRLQPVPVLPGSMGGTPAGVGPETPPLDKPLFLSLLPHQTQMDGFFAALLRRVS